MGRKYRRRNDMPLYMDREAIIISGWMLSKLWPRMGDKPVYDLDTLHVAQMRDGSWWAKFTPQTVFWAYYWFEIPKTVGERVRRLGEFL